MKKSTVSDNDMEKYNIPKTTVGNFLFVIVMTIVGMSKNTKNELTNNTDVWNFDRRNNRNVLRLVSLESVELDLRLRT